MNVNAFDEVPNSTWFTNRNHLRAVPVAELRQGPDSVFLPAKPWTIKHAKQGGWSAGFQIKDADGKKWLVKLDPRGYPQLELGRRHGRAHAAPRRGLQRAAQRSRSASGAATSRSTRICCAGTKGERFTDADLDSLLAHGAVFADGSYSAFASLFIAGHVLGAPSMNRLAARRLERLVLAHQSPRAPWSLRPLLLDQQLGHQGSPVPRHVRRDHGQPRARRALHPRRRIVVRRSGGRTEAAVGRLREHGRLRVDRAAVRHAGFRRGTVAAGASGDRHSRRSGTSNRRSTSPRTSGNWCRSRPSAR